MSHVTVVIPTYNGARYVADALRSVFGQSTPPGEIIIADDCSTDGTVREARRVIGETTIPIRMITLGSNSGGPARPINVGVAAAASSLIAILDQDDVYAPDALERMEEVLDASPSLGCSGMLCAAFPDGKRLLRDEILNSIVRAGTSRKTWFEIPPAAALRHLLIFGQFLVGYPGFMFRRELWTQKSGVCESLRIASDLELLCWLCSSHGLGLIPEVGYRRREHETNICRRTLEMEVEDVQVRIRYARRLSSIQRDSRIKSVIAREALNIAYELRSVGRYWESLRWYVKSVTEGHVTAGAVTGITKLMPHWLLGSRCGPSSA